MYQSNISIHQTMEKTKDDTYQHIEQKRMRYSEDFLIQYRDKYKEPLEEMVNFIKNKKNRTGNRQRIPDSIHQTAEIKIPVIKKKFIGNFGESNEVVMKEIQGILNKMTETNYERLADQLKKIKLSSKEQLEKMAELIFNKALTEANFSHMYAKVCRKLINIKIEDETTKESKRPFTLAMILLTRCQHEFEVELNRKIENADEETENKIKKRRIGLMRFIGELHNVNLLHQKVIDTCLLTILDKGNETMIEYACKLLSTVKEKYKDRTDETYMDIKCKLIDLKKTEMSSRVKFLVMDLLEKELKRSN